MNAEKFWMGWLRVTMIIVLAGGIFLAIFSQFVQQTLLEQKIKAIFFHGIVPPQGVYSLTCWLSGVAGAVMAGWGFSMLYVVNHAFKRREKWAWHSIFYPVLAWYLIDSGISAYFGVGMNVVINSILFLQLIAPLLFLRNTFFQKVSPGRLKNSV